MSYTNYMVKVPIMHLQQGVSHYSVAINYLFGVNSDYKSYINASVDIMKTESIYKEKFDNISSPEEIMKYCEGLLK